MIEINNLSYVIAIILSIITIYFVSQYNKDKKEHDLDIPSPSPGMKKVIDALRELHNKLDLLEHKIPLINSSISNRHNIIRNEISDMNDRETFRQAYILSNLENLENNDGITIQ